MSCSSGTLICVRAALTSESSASTVTTGSFAPGSWWYPPVSRTSTRLIVVSSAATASTNGRYCAATTSNSGWQLLIAYASMRPRNSGFVAASIAPTLETPSHTPNDSTPASRRVATTSPTCTSSARNRAAQRIIASCNCSQVADAPSTVRRNCLWGSASDMRFTMAGSVS